ncbi:uncharacterized protein ACR2FA_004221 [Aphomia sociella]
MRSAQLCVLFALIVQKEGSYADGDSEFKPMPIPVNNWHYNHKGDRHGTSHEVLDNYSSSESGEQTRYWEDALRHSVYLTLVRDKIDQLIAKSTISPNSKPDQQVSKEVDDHNLWDKIKNAPFDRIQDDNHPTYGDVTMMAKGRLVEEDERFRFIEDDKAQKCNDDSCMNRVKAFWSVKRVRQRDGNSSSGKYHYELTFSVSQMQKKQQKKPYENPIRIFTVRENPPDIIVAKPHDYRYHSPIQTHTPRPERSIWFHKNVVPNHYNQGRRYHHSLDRIFSSLFSDDDTVAEPPKYKPSPYMPPVYPQHSKFSYVGTSSEQHQQKKLMPYPYKPHSYKYVRPPLSAPPVSHFGPQQYTEYDTHMGHSFVPSDTRYVAPSNIVKTTRPAVLPTPSEPILMETTKNYNLDVNAKYSVGENITKETEPMVYHKVYNKAKPQAVKISYFSDHVRPPVFNAPPGVFVTMDKKPFKPMPPMKLHTSKPVKSRPLDFRPSPQLDDMRYSDSDSKLDTAFRPMVVNLTNSSSKNTESNINKKEHKHATINVKKPPKKHENIKSQRLTTSAPDIITVHNNPTEDSDSIEWASIIGAFTRTTPMESQTEKMYTTENIETTTEIYSPTPVVRKRITTTSIPENKIITTPKPKKRTRPPPKFSKPEKFKKHKRITTTTKTPEKSQVKKPFEDLTPQASSAATKPNKPWPSKNNTESTTPSTTTTVTTTTRLPVFIITTPSTTTVLNSNNTTSISQTFRTTQPKTKNRFRQSTLMQKGTSVNHDKWSANTDKNKTTLPLTAKYSRRKGSNFQGYVTPSSHNNVDTDRKTEDHNDHISSSHKPQFDSNIEVTNINNVETSSAPSYENTADQYDINSESPSDFDQDHESDEVTSTKAAVINKKEPNDQVSFDVTSTTASETNEINNPEEVVVTERTIIASSHSVSKNKTKCKKKKHNNLMVPNESSTVQYETSSTSTTTKHTVTEVLDDLSENFTYDDISEDTKETTPSKPELYEEESKKHEEYLPIDEDFDDFFSNLDNKRHPDNKNDEHYDYDEDENDPQTEGFSPFDNENEDESPRQSDDDSYNDYSEHPLSFLELMAME